MEAMKDMVGVMEDKNGRVGGRTISRPEGHISEDPLLLVNIYPPQRPTTPFGLELVPPPGGPDLMHRRSDSEPEACCVPMSAQVG